MKMLRNPLIGLSPAQFALALLIKFLLACLYGYVFLEYYGGDDTWMLHSEGLKQAVVLKEDPLLFFQQLMPSPGVSSYNGFEFITHYLQDLEFYIQTKTLAIFSLITQGNYYLNAFFFSLMMIWGQYWLYVFFIERHRGVAMALYVVIFFFVPAVFWISGIRSDAWLFLSISLSIFSFHRWLMGGSGLYLFAWMVGMAGMLIFRLPYALLAVPAFAAWMLHAKAKKRISISFIAMYAICLLMFFGSYYFTEESALTKVVVERQHEFGQLNGNTRYPLTPLTADPTSFLIALPQAVVNTMIRPYPAEARGLFQYLAVAENFLVLLVVASAVIVALRKRSAIEASSVALLCYAISLYVLIGWIVPFPGAIVRYRAIPELLVVSTAMISLSRYIIKKKI